MDGLGSQSSAKLTAKDVCLTDEVDPNHFKKPGAGISQAGGREGISGGQRGQGGPARSLFGNAVEARRRAEALGLSTRRDVQYEATLALVFVGNTARAQTLADDLSRRFPEDTVVQFNYLPKDALKIELD